MLTKFKLIAAVLIVVGLVAFHLKAVKQARIDGNNKAELICVKPKVDALVKAQKEIIIRLGTELKTSLDDLDAVNKKRAANLAELAEIRNEKEPACTSISPNSVRLLNKAACEYNLRNGYPVTTACALVK